MSLGVPLATFQFADNALDGVEVIKPIRSTDDLGEAKARLAELQNMRNPGDFADEIEVLSILIDEFERKRSYSRTPIEAIKLVMHEKGLTPRQLEPFIGSRARVSEVLSGKRQLSLDMIRSLHQGLGIAYEALISDRAKPNASTLSQLSELGFEMDARSLFSTTETSSGPALLRQTRSQRAASKTDQGALLLWQSAVLRKAESADALGLFRQSDLTPSVLRQLCRTSTKVDGPRHVVRALAEKGIAVVIMPSLPGTFLDGAAMASADGRPVIGLTLRHDRVDNFWFTLVHEVCHVALHFTHLLETKGAFVDDMEIRSEDEYELEADALARDSLIPSDFVKQVYWGPETTSDDLIMLATRARVHISVVAGRWQRDHQNYKKFSRLIDRNSVRAMFT